MILTEEIEVLGEVSSSITVYRGVLKLEKYVRRKHFSKNPALNHCYFFTTVVTGCTTVHNMTYYPRGNIFVRFFVTQDRGPVVRLMELRCIAY